MKIVGVYPSIETKDQVAVLLQRDSGEQFVLTYTLHPAEVVMLTNLLNDLKK